MLRLSLLVNTLNQMIKIFRDLIYDKRRSKTGSRGYDGLC